jgi:hypothetical protein
MGLTDFVYFDDVLGECEEHLARRRNRKPANIEERPASFGEKAFVTNDNIDDRAKVEDGDPLFTAEGKIKSRSMESTLHIFQLLRT